MSQGHSRRNFLALIGAVAVEATPPVCFAAGGTLTSLLMGAHVGDAMAEGAAAARTGILSATLTWRDPTATERQGAATERVRVRVSRHPDLSSPVVDLTLAGEEMSYRLGVAPSSTYYWSVVPVTGKGEVHERTARGSFTTLAPARDPQADCDNVRYAGVRTGALWFNETPVATASPQEPLSPWFYRKRYDDHKPPTFDEVKPALPVPILDSEPQLLDMYWYCWRTLLDQWVIAPTSPDHHAVANMLGSRKLYGGRGDTMLWDTAIVLQFARYGHHAYPFATVLDNIYARQHENGFICRQTDKNNQEVYAISPVNPPLCAWAEWAVHELTGHDERMAQVLTPLVKQYEWWLRFQRRENGLYWANGPGEGMDDNPRKFYMYYSEAATAYQALTALSIARIARVAHRPDLVDYFESEHTALGKMVNEHFWDKKHQLYNDLTNDGQFITEFEPGAFCKHAFMFWPLLAEIAPPERVKGLVRELLNPQSFFRVSGVPSLSADSVGYDPRASGSWRGEVWPMIMCVVPSGLKVSGQWDVAQVLAQKYVRALNIAWQKDRTITESLRPDEPVTAGLTPDMEWCGIGPVQHLIEYFLGFDVSAPQRTVTWRITRTDRHGIENLRLGKTKVDFLCASRSSPAAPCQLMVTSEAQLTLTVHLNGSTTTRRLAPGVTRFVVG